MKEAQLDNVVRGTEEGCEIGIAGHCSFRGWSERCEAVKGQRENCDVGIVGQDCKRDNGKGLQ